MKSSLLRFAVTLATLLATARPARSAADYALPYSFTTLAGVSSIGSQDGTGSAARFYSPRAVALDAAGNAFVVDTGNHVIRKVTPAGVVTTFAGTAGIEGSADGTGAAARFADPQDIAIDAADNLYVTDLGNHTVRKITPAGVVTTFAGLAGVTGTVDGPGNLARFNGPRGITVDATGNVFVTESGNHAIRKITPAGVVSTFAHASFPAVFGGINFAYGAIAVDANGAVYVCRSLGGDTVTYPLSQSPYYTVFGGVVTRIAPDGTTTDLLSANLFRFFDGRGIDNGHVSDLAIDRNGNLVGTMGARIFRYSFADTMRTFVSGDGTLGSLDGNATTAKFGFPLSLALDRNQGFVIADTGSNNLRRVTADGTATTLAGLALDQASGFVDGSGTAARFGLPAGVAVDAAGNTYLADSSNHCIRKVSPAGVVSLLAGGPGFAGEADGMATAARFSNPMGVAVDANGYVFVADTGNHTIRRISPTGETGTYAGVAGVAGTQDGPLATARLTSPRGVALDSAGNLYVTAGSTVRKITPAQEVSTLAGNPAVAGSQDGTGTAAEFTAPTGIAVDGSGNVYVTEVADNPAIARVRKITPAGVVTTIAGGAHGTTDGNGLAARFHDPIGIAVDATGNLFIADAFNQTVRRVTPQGTVTTLAGLTDVPGSTDGAGTDARFYYPQGIAVDATGKLRVSSGTTIRLGEAATGPTIATQPVGMSVTAGGNASFSVTANSVLPMTYQWQKNAVNIAGATTATLSLSAVTTDHAGDYTVVVTNSLGSVTSTKATLTVTAAPVRPPPPPSSGGGGGGAPSGWFLAALAALGIVRKRAAGWGFGTSVS